MTLADYMCQENLEEVDSSALKIALMYQYEGPRTTFKKRPKKDLYQGESKQP